MPPALADDIVVVARDALGTVSLELRVDCDGGVLTIEVADDGVATLARSQMVARLRERTHHQCRRTLPCRRSIYSGQIACTARRHRLGVPKANEHSRFGLRPLARSLPQRRARSEAGAPR